MLAGADFFGVLAGPEQVTAGVSFARGKKVTQLSSLA